MLAQKKMPDGQKEEISQVGILLLNKYSKLCYIIFFEVCNQ